MNDIGNSSPSNQASSMPPIQPGNNLQRRHGALWWIGWLVGGGCLLLFVFIIGMAIFVGAMRGSSVSLGGRVALIRISGTITSGESVGSLFGDSIVGSDTIIRYLDHARRDSSIKAVVLRIDSPGGSAAASEEIYNEIRRVRLSKPVYASMGDVAASGGYYISAACDRIYADKATLTGSIGVIFETPNLAGLMKKLGVDFTVIKSGKYKDIGSPSRAMTPEEKQMLQAMVNDIYNQFVDAVAQGRRMPREKVVSLANGAVFTGSQAVKLGLVDQIGGLRDAVRDAGKAGGIKGEVKVQRYGRYGGLLGMLGGDDISGASSFDLLVEKVARRLAAGDRLGEGLR